MRKQVMPRESNFTANGNLNVFLCYCRCRHVEATLQGVAQASLHCWDRKLA